MLQNDSHCPSLPPLTETNISVSIIICTYNRAEFLIKYALSSLLLQKIIPDSQVEVLVVDNASTDDTRSQVMDFIKRNSQIPIRYFFEANQGLSHARNRGITKSRGDIIAFLDDDAEATPEWLITIVDAYYRYPDAWAVGGRSIPLCDMPKPKWFAGRMLGYLGGHDLGQKEQKLIKKYLQGANMSFRRETFSIIGNFRTDLGVIGYKRLQNDEGELFRRMQKDGLSIYYIPEALLFHHQTERVRSFWGLIETRYLGGISDSAVENKYFGRIFICLKSCKMMLNIILSFLLIPINILITNWAEAYFLFLRSVFSTGYVIGMFQQLVCRRDLLKPDNL